MPKELKNIAEEIMKKIDMGEIKMRPKGYFIMGSIFTFIGLVSTVVVSTFSIGLIRFSLRSHGPMGQYRFDQILASFPWWTLVLAILGLVLGVWLIRKYDFSYKIKPWLVIVGFILAIIIGGYVIDITGVNDVISRQGPMKGMMKNYMLDNDIKISPMFINRR
jgi:magnesium-transporting ATPase (P-type)